MHAGHRTSGSLARYPRIKILPGVLVSSPVYMRAHPGCVRKNGRLYILVYSYGGVMFSFF